MGYENLTCDLCEKQLSSELLPPIAVPDPLETNKEVICYDCFHARVPILLSLVTTAKFDNYILAKFNVNDRPLISSFRVLIPAMNRHPHRNDYARKILVASIAQPIRRPDQPNPMLSYTSLIYGSRNPYNIPYDTFKTGNNAAEIAATVAVTELIEASKVNARHRPKRIFSQYSYVPFNTDWAIRYDLQCDSDLEPDRILRKFTLTVYATTQTRDLSRTYQIQFISPLMGFEYAILRGPFTQLTQLALHDIIKFESEFRTLDSFLLKK